MNLPVFLHDLISFCDVLAAYSLKPLTAYILFQCNCLKFVPKEKLSIHDVISHFLHVLSYLYIQRGGISLKVKCPEILFTTAEACCLWWGWDIGFNLYLLSLKYI